MPIEPSRAGFATSIPSSPDVDRFNELRDEKAEVKRRLQQVDADIKAVAAKVTQVDISIKKVVGRINKLVVGSQEWTFLVDAKKQLDDEKKDLRDEKKRLDDEKKRLDDEKKRLDEKVQLPIIQNFSDFNDFIEGELKKISKLGEIGKRNCLSKFPTDQVALDRDPQIRQFLQHAWDRFQRPTQSFDKADNPFLATQASPGMGKSSFIDVMTGLSEEQITKCSPEGATPAFIAAMCRAIHLTVDFNGFQRLTDYDVEHPTAGLAIRLLHTYFASAAMPYGRFCAKVKILFDPKSVSALTLEEAIDIIQRYHNQSRGISNSDSLVFVYIDEFRKLGEHIVSSLPSNDSSASLKINSSPQINLVLSAVGGLISGNQHINVLITTLDQMVLTQQKSISGRGTTFISLPLLDGHALFKRHPMYQQHPFVQYFVADLGGHARSLNFLLEVLNSFHSQITKPTYSSLSEKLLDKMLHFGSNRLPAQLIIRSVLSEYIYLDEVVGGEKHQTVESYIASGDLLHSTKYGKDTIVPRLSLFRIRLALAHAKAQKYVLVSEKADYYLRKLVGIETELDWRSFETYVTNFEALRHCLFALQGVESRKIGELYPGAVVGKDKSILDVPIPISIRDSVEYLTEPFVPDLKTASMYNNSNKVLVPLTGNPGFDVVIPFRKDSFIFLECRYSAEEGTSSVADAIHKHTQIQRLMHSIPNADLPKSHILVMLAMRSSHSGPKKIATLPSNVIMMNRELLCNMFGETFAARGSLIIDHCANLSSPQILAESAKVEAIKSSPDSSTQQL